MIGANEVDLVFLGFFFVLVFVYRAMMKNIGFKTQMRSQHYVHLHAIVGPLDKKRKRKLREIVTAALGQERLMPDQLQLDGLHSNKSKQANLEHIASYMYKSRLQFSDYVYENLTMRKKKRYHTPYKGKQLIDYLNAMAKNKQFKGRKCEYGLK